MSRALRPIACVMAAAAVAAVGLAVVADAVVAHGEHGSLSVLNAVSLAAGVGAPACVGLFLLLRRPTTLVAWILVAGALSVAVVMGAFGVASLALDRDRGSALGAWALVPAQEWLVLFAWPLALA